MRSVRALVAIIGWSLGLAWGQIFAIAAAQAAYPMSFENKGRLVTVWRAPQKAVAFGVPAAEIMAALNLGSVMIGRVQGSEPLWPEFEAALKGVPKVLAKDQVDSEFASGADFFFGRFAADSRELSWDWLPVYVLEPGGFEDLYRRIRDIGQIFQVQGRAETVLAGLNASLNRTVSRLTDYVPVKTLVYDPRPDGIYVAGDTDFESRLLVLAGGQNVFADRPGWSKATAEEIVARQPEAFIVLKRGPIPTETRVANLKAHPVLNKLKAVENDKILVMGLEALESGLRAGQTVEILAKFFHPSLF
jgi:iron complex transport system substrate-binding protein